MKLLEADEVAAMIGMSRDWVYEQSRRGRIPTVRLGRCYRYREEAIAAWIAELERGAAVAVPLPRRRRLASQRGRVRSLRD